MRSVRCVVPCLAGVALGLASPMARAETVVAGPVVADPGAADPTTDAPPKPRAEIGLALFYNTDAGASVSGFVKTDTLLGPGHELSFQAQTGEHGSQLDLDYRNHPFWGRKDLTFDLGVTGLSSRPDDIFDFSSRSAEVQPEWAWTLPPDTIVSPYVLYSVGTVRGAAGSDSALIADQEGTRRRLGLGADVQFAARRDDQGQVSLLTGAGLELGRTDGGHRYGRLSVDAVGQGPLGTRAELRAAFKAATIVSFAGQTPIGDRHVLGQSALRGFAYGGFGPRDLAATDTPALGGNSYVTAQFDVTFPQAFGEGSRIVPGVFLDLGSLWGLDRRGGGPAGANPVDDAFHLRASVGVTFGFATDYGVIQLSLAKAVIKQDYDRTEPFYLSFVTRF